MPYVIRPPVRKVAFAGALAALLLGALLASSQSQAYVSSSGCGSVPLSQPFAAFGDNADYTPAEGGHFEFGTEAWSLYGAGLVNGNEPFYVRDPGDSKSLSIPMWGKAISAHFCVDQNYPHFRFFARLSEGSYGLLMVRARWTEGDDTEQEVLGFLAGSQHRSWRPSNMLPLAEPLRLTDRARTQHVRLVFTALAGDWQIDDVYVDPYRR